MVEHYQGEVEKETFKEDIEEIVKEDDSLRMSTVNKTVNDIKALMKENDKVIEDDKDKE